MSSTAWPEVLGPALVEREQRADARVRLFDLHVELFVGAPARDRETVRSFEVLALGFMPRLDPATVARTARALAPCEDTPPAVLEYLVQRSPETRKAVLDLAPSLPPAVSDLLIGTGKAALLATRRNLDAAAQDRLLVLEDPAVDDALAANGGTALADAALRRLVGRAAGRPALGRTLLARADLSLADEAALYLAADPARRMRIRERLEGSAGFRPRLPPRLLDEDMEALVAHAGLGDVAGFELGLSTALGFPPDTPWRLLRPERQELLALALVVLGFEEESAVRIFLTLHPAIGHSVRSVFALTEAFRETARATALALLEAVLNEAGEREAPRNARHVPAFDPSGTPSPAPAFTLPAAEPPAYREPQRLAG